MTKKINTKGKLESNQVNLMNDNLFNVSFKKNLGKNYMCIDPYITLFDSEQGGTAYSEDFRVKMVRENTIDGILSMHLQYVNGIPSFCYDITGLQSLNILLDNIPLNYNILCHLFSGICTAFNSCEQYMLNQNKFLLSPEHIFISADFRTVRLCYFPLKDEDILSSAQSLFDYLLKKVDHSDERCVYMAYSAHKDSHSSDFTINSLYSYLSVVPDNDMPPTPHNNIASVEENEPVSLDTDSGNMSPLVDTDNHQFIFKVFIFICLSLSGIVGIFVLYVFDIISTYVFGISLILTLAICGYNGYNLYKNPYRLTISHGLTISRGLTTSRKLTISKKLSDKNNLTDTHLKSEDTVPQSRTMKDSGSTLILSSPENPDFHMLVYSGTDMTSKIELTHYPFVIGKSENCDGILSNPIISHLHAKISCLPDDSNSLRYYIEDLNSTNGTFLNSTPLTPYEKYTISSGDYISFGHLTYIFR